MNKNKQSQPMKRICVVDSPFTLYYYFLLFGVNDEDLFITSYNIPKHVRSNLNHIYFPITRIYPYDSLKHVLIDLLLFIRIAFEILILRIKLHSITKGHEIKALGHGHLLFSFPLYEYPNSALIEDGIGNYAELPEYKEFSPIPQFIFNKFFGKYIRKPMDGFGTHPNIKEIYLSKKQGFSESIKDKVIVNELDTLVNSINPDQKNKILKMFNVHEIANNIKETDILLLTEPFTESFELTLEEELEIYNDIISKHNPKDIIIKPHPRETKDYKKYFPNIRIITTPFPLEIFNLIDVKFKKIITIHSSAALNFKDVEVEFYEGEINNEQVNAGRKQVKKQYYEMINKN